MDVLPCRVFKTQKNLDVGVKRHGVIRVTNNSNKVHPTAMANNFCIYFIFELKTLLVFQILETKLGSQVLQICLL